MVAIAGETFGRAFDASLAWRRARGFSQRMIDMAATDDAQRHADIEAVAQRRDREAFARLFRFYAPRVKAYLRRMGAGDDAAEDLAQDVLASVWHRATQFDRSKASLSTWIYTIARNKRIDCLRRDKRPEHEPFDPDADGAEAPRGDRIVEADKVRAEVQRAIAELPHEQAELLRIFYFDEKTHSVIAGELGLPLGTVKSRLRLALSKLRVTLGGLAQ